MVNYCVFSLATWKNNKRVHFVANERPISSNPRCILHADYFRCRGWLIAAFRVSIPITVDCCILIQSPRTDAAYLPLDPAGIPKLPRGIYTIVVAPADTAGAPPPPLAHAATTNRRQCGCESPLGPSPPGGENQPVTPSVHLCTASTAFVMAMAAKSTPPTSLPVTVLLLRFGRDGTAIWRIRPWCSGWWRSRVVISLSGKKSREKSVW